MATSKEYTISRKISDTEEEIIQVDSAKNADTATTAVKTQKNLAVTVGPPSTYQWEDKPNYAGVLFNGRFTTQVILNRDSFSGVYGERPASSDDGEAYRVVVDLKDTGITAGKYNNITVDKKGRAIAGENKDYALKSDVPDVSKMVTTDGAQDIYGVKKFSNGIKLGDGNTLLGASDVSNIENYMPQKDGTLAVLSDIPDISSKANIDGGNTFTGKQTLTNPPADGYSIDASGYIKGSWLQAPSTGKAGSNTGKVCVLDGSGWVYYRTPAEIVSDGGGAKASDIPTKVSELTNDSGYTTNKGTVTQVKINGTTNSPDSAGLVDLGTVGGSSDNSKFDYTVLTNEDLNTVIVAGRYRAEKGNTCKHRPFILTGPAFFLTVEKTESGSITQTAYLTAGEPTSYYEWYVRYSTNNGSSWYSWRKQQSIDERYSQAFGGTKTFSNINITNSLEFNGSSGSSSQFAMSQGSASAPKWVNLQVKVNGTIYTPDSNGLIDLGEISGGGGSSSQYNDIY